MHKFFFWAVALAVFSGCASGGGAFSSKTNPENVTSVKKIFFLTDAKNEFFNETLNAGFESSLSSNLSTCGIDLQILQLDKLDLDFKQTLKSEMDRYDPDALLLMQSDGGDVVRNTGGGGDSGTLYFNLSLSDPNSKKSIWLARLGYRFLTNNMFSSDEGSGSRLGDQLYNRLVNDEVLPGCTAKIAKK